ncbi:MAG: flippase-like domain-containing protein, partial [Anaerolineaceae bacterium]|nr:flippase-like domain-containing protein [Anaerolineaceae bacterium]
SLKVPFSLGTVVAGYGIAQLFFYVTPSPAGIGFVEGLFPLTLNALNVPFSMAVLITLIYRGITLWFSFGVGFYSFRRLHRTSVENITANDRSETGNPTNPDPSAGTQ